VRPGWHRGLGLLKKISLLKELGALAGKQRKKLEELKIPVSAYYRWQRQYHAEGGDGLASKRRAPKRIWNRLTEDERRRVLEVTLNNPDLSCRLLAVKITDEEDFSISPSTVYRLLKAET